MKIAFCSNFMNHHQLEFSLELYNNQSIEYVFIANEKIPDERIKMGYEDLNNKYPFIVRAYENEKQKQKALKLCDECDVLIIGSASEEYIINRMKNNKVTFRYYERILKKGIWHILDPRLMRYLLKNHYKYRKKNMFMLCASAYTKFDFSLVGAYKNKFFKWGYFPKTPKFEKINDIISNKDINSILCVGRLIKLKHPEIMIELAKKLKKEGIQFNIKIIGNGELESLMKAKIKKEELEDYITMLGAKPASEVQKYMEKSQIFIASSDYNEGWGAVVNEAMGNACAVIASKTMGSVPYLIKNGINGYQYNYRNQRELNDKVIKVLKDKILCKKLEKNAYETIVNEWNAVNAANRLISLSETILRDNNQDEIKKLFNDGPCSLA